MVHVYVDDGELVIELDKLEKLFSLKSRLRIPLSCIEKIVRLEDVDEGERERLLPRMKLGGMRLGSIVYGSFSTGVGRGFFATRNLERSVVIYTRGCVPYRVIVVEAPDPATMEAIENALSKRLGV